MRSVINQKINFSVPSLIDLMMFSLFNDVDERTKSNQNVDNSSWSQNPSFIANNQTLYECIFISRLANSIMFTSAAAVN